MNRRLDTASRWIYSGIWGVLVRWFRVPEEPPTLPAGSGETLQVFQPAPGFLRYLIFKFWIPVAILSGVICLVTLLITFGSPLAAAIFLIVALTLLIVPSILGYVALHLRYDTTWYVVTSRSLRIRRGVWVIHETTITFENVQNIAVHQGPLERWFGIGNVMIKTAGGGGQAGPESHPAVLGPHVGLIEGVADPQALRDLILPRLRQAKTAGLGDEDDEERQAASAGWQPQHLAVLREIRGLAVQLAEAG